MTAPFVPIDVLQQLSLEEKIQLTAGTDLWRTASIPRLSVPYIKLTDGPNGARGGGDFNESHPSALFPSPSCLGSTWDTDLAAAMGAGIAEDGIKKQCHVILGPTINIQRDPRAGRYFESYSEDPVLTGNLAAAWVRGCQSTGVAATMKHFVGNESETDRRFVSSDIGEVSLREVYLEPFRRLMKGVVDTDGHFGGQPAGVMTAYNRVNGTSSSENVDLLQDILKGEWGFKGLVMSDWFSLHAHGLKVTDLEMPGPTMFRKESEIKQCLEKGELSEADLDHRVLKVLELIVKVAPLGFSKSPEAEKEHSVDDKKVSETIRRIGAEGAVLLKNVDDILPMIPKKGLRIACIGKPWVQAVQSGGGSANLTPQKITQPLESLKKALETQDVNITHHDGCNIHNLPPIIETQTTLEFYEGRDTGDKKAKLLGTMKIDKVELAPADTKPFKLEPNNFWIRAQFKVQTNVKGRYRLAPICLGSMELSERGSKHKYQGEENLFEYFLNPARKYAPFEIDGGENESIAVSVDYLSEILDDQLKESLMCGLKCGLEIIQDEDAQVEEAAMMATKADIVLIMTATGKDWESEGYDRPHLDLPRRQSDLVIAVSKAQPECVVLNITGSVVRMPWKDQVKGLVQCWFGGQEGGESLVDVILGRGSAPASGKMANTWPVNIQDHSSGCDTAHFPGVRTKTDGLHVNYAEGLLVGYKHYNINQSPSSQAPAFYFGQGIGGYTSFVASLINVEGSCNSRKEAFKVHIHIKNTGQRSGKYVVQLYVRPNQVLNDQCPVQKLAAFQSVHLEAQKECSISIPLDGDAFSQWSVENHCWQVAQQSYTIALASSASLLPEATLGIHIVEIAKAWTWNGVGV